MEQGFLGIDVGSTAIKVGIIAQGTSIYHSSQALTTYDEADGARYQKATEILQTIADLLREIPREFMEQIGSLSFSVAMHSLMPVVNGQFDKIFLWSDQQATEVIRQLPVATARRFYLRSGTPIHPMSTVAKLLYFQQAQTYPENTSWWGLKELLMDYFTGQVAIDVATASATGMCNVESGQWDEEILAYLGVEKGQLAPIIPVNQVFEIREERVKQFGLKPQTSVYCGASDGCLAAYAGLVTTGIANSLTIGTSAALRSIGPDHKLDVIQQPFAYRLTDKLFVSGGPSNNGGSVLAWASGIFSGDSSTFFRELPEILETTPIGAGGVKFYPFLNGERAPYWDAELTGGFQNLRITTTRQEMIRSVVEGILLNLRTLKPSIIGSGALTLSGGFFDTPELAQLTVDVLGNEAVLSKENEPIFGLYYLLVGDKNPDVSLTNVEKIVPNREKNELYETFHQGYFKF